MDKLNISNNLMNIYYIILSNICDGIRIKFIYSVILKYTLIYYVYLVSYLFKFK